jgi:3-hydroxyisobutyrate dehydrogenase
MTRVGFIGLGAMGALMARNLHRAGLLCGVWNRSHEKAANLSAELGVPAFKNAAELAGICQALVICVSADADVTEVVGTIEAALPRGALVVDSSTVSATTAQTLGARLARRGVDFLDCPVSGGVEGARLATLAFMCGGDSAAFARAQPVLATMGKTMALFGPNGAGQAAKATNQIMCAGIIQAVAEAMAFAKSQGLPLDTLIETLSKGAGSSWYFVNRAPFMAAEKYPAGFRVRLHEKDLKICRDMAAAHGARLPLVESTLDQYAKLTAQGFGDEDISSIFRLTNTLFTGQSS